MIIVYHKQDHILQLHPLQCLQTKLRMEVKFLF